MADELDPVDARILDILQQDAGLSVAEVAERVGLSASPCWRRIKRLEDTGMILRRVTILDAVKLGLDFEVYAIVKLNLPSTENLNVFEAAVANWPEVVQCATITGREDYVLRIITSIPVLHSLSSTGRIDTGEATFVQFFWRFCAVRSSIWCSLSA